MSFLPGANPSSLLSVCAVKARFVEPPDAEKIDLDSLEDFSGPLAATPQLKWRWAASTAFEPRLCLSLLAVFFFDSAPRLLNHETSLAGIFFVALIQPGT